MVISVASSEPGEGGFQRPRKGMKTNRGKYTSSLHAGRDASLLAGHYLMQFQWITKIGGLGGRPNGGAASPLLHLRFHLETERRVRWLAPQEVHRWVVARSRRRRRHAA